MMTDESFYLGHVKDRLGVGRDPANERKGTVQVGN